MTGPVLLAVVIGLSAAAAGLSAAVVWLLRDRRRLAGRLRAEQAACAGQRDALDRAALTVERARIAHELHDVVAHGVSMMTLGVGAGRMIMEKDPARARETLRAAEESGRQALTELQRVVGLLSAEGGARTRAPQPRLSDLSDLLARVRTEGLTVDVVEDGRPVEIGPALELSAYRIVQEALGNTLRHARARSAHVTLRWRPGFLDVLVRDDGRAAPTVTAGSGLAGIRERVTLFGGTLETAPLAEGGFELRARLPTAEPRGPFPPWAAVGRPLSRPH
ncbi:sensor histidine kinase [Planomonospora corallina]|uniref:histidine kinase n=1 Tax=Planomonospora corallina TaxID=1806052 RepID=A0ABV8I9V2_9ACTN